MNVRYHFKAIALMSAASLFVISLNAQKVDNGESVKTGKNQPRVTIKVNKKRDDKGNVTQYDSTYVSSWSSDGNIPENMDSVMKSMHQGFFKNFSFNDQDSLTMPFGFNFQPLNDSLGAFNDSAFFNHKFGNMNMFGENFADFDKIMQQQQRLMQQFFQHEPTPKGPDDIMPPPPAQIPKKQNNSLKKEKIMNKGGYQVNT